MSDVTKAELMQYVERVYILEKLKYEQTILYNQLASNVRNLKNQNTTPVTRYSLEKKRGVGDFFEMIFYCIFGGGGFGIIVGIILGIFFIDFHFSSFLAGCVYFFKIGAIIGLGIAIVSILWDNANIEKKNNDTKKQNQELLIQHDSLVRSNDKRIMSIQSEMDIIKFNVNETQRVLSMYYDKDIIYSKYRGLIPVCSIYEYFKSGRCSTLEGHEGAYNIYENELRLNLIITKLDDVIRQLEQIKSAQYILYDAISTSNSIADKMSKRICTIANNIGDVRNDIEVTRYNSQITAKNSEFMKNLAILRY